MCIRDSTDGHILARIALYLGEAELTASHVSTCRLYHNLSVDSALSETLASAIRRVYDVSIIVVPVVACGLTPATAADVVIEIFARAATGDGDYVSTPSVCLEL